MDDDERFDLMNLIGEIKALAENEDFEWAYYKCQDLMSSLITLQRKVDDAKNK